uniref:Uncharacterized protein n=1 Tax=Arundo donax TaxID=35708 RepID=A0A0A9CPZ2_ARUDO
MTYYHYPQFHVLSLPLMISHLSIQVHVFAPIVQYHSHLSRDPKGSSLP